MEFHEDFGIYVIIFLIVFGISMAILMGLAFSVNVWWSFAFTDIGNQYTPDNIPADVAWQIFFDSIWINLLICIPIAAIIGIGIAFLVAD